MALRNQFPLVVITMQTAYYWHHYWKHDNVYLRSMVRCFCTLHLLQRRLTWRRFEGHAGDCSHCVSYGVPYVYEYVLQTSVTSEDHLNQLELNTVRAVWSLLIQSRAGALGSSIKWYIASSL